MKGSLVADPLSDMIKEAVREVLSEFIKTTDIRPQRLLTPAQAAEYINLSLSRMYELLKEEDLPAVRSGRAVRVDKDDLDAWIKRHKQTERE